MRTLKHKNVEYSEVSFSELEKTMRIDAEFYDATHIKVDKELGKFATDKLTQVCHVSDGNHFKISERFSDEGIPYYRGQDTTGCYFIEQSEPVRIDKETFNRSFMKRSHLKKGDILLSIVGTIGSVSLVTTNQEATCSCKLAILRCSQVLPEFLFSYLISHYGNSQIQKFARGALQTGFILADSPQIKVPQVSKGFQSAIASLVTQSYIQKQKSLDVYKEAEELLYKELNLDTWKPKKSKFKSYNVQFEIEDNHSIIQLSTMLKGDRLDAEYWDAACLELLDRLSKFDTRKLGSEIIIKNGFPFQSKQFIEVGEGEPFIRIRDCKPHFIQTADLTKLDNDYVKKLKVTKANTGDIVIGMDGLKWFYGSLVVEPVYVNQRVCHIQIKPKSQFTPEYILLVINSKIGQMQLLRQMTIADTVGHIKNTDVAGLIIPASKNVKAITKKVKSVQLAEQQSKSLIDVAKKAVEIFVEQDEKEALKYIKNEQNKVK